MVLIDYFSSITVIVLSNVLHSNRQNLSSKPSLFLLELFQPLFFLIYTLTLTSPIRTLFSITTTTATTTTRQIIRISNPWPNENFLIRFRRDRSLPLP